MHWQNGDAKVSLGEKREIVSKLQWLLYTEGCPHEHRVMTFGIYGDDHVHANKILFQWMP